MLHAWIFVALFCYCADVALAGGCCCGPTCPPPCPAPPSCPAPACPQPFAVVCKTPECPTPPPCPSPLPCPSPEPCEPCPVCPEPPPPPPCPKCPEVTLIQPCPGLQIPATTTDCCQGCQDNSGCSVKSRKRVRSRSRLQKHKLQKRDIGSDDHEVTADTDPTCNNEALRTLMIANMNDNVTESKRRIQKEAESKIKQSFNVICSEASFSYVAHTNIYCQTSSHNIHCYAFSL